MERVARRVLNAGAMRHVDAPERVAKALSHRHRPAGPRVHEVEASISAALAGSLGRPRARCRAFIRAVVAARGILNTSTVLASIACAALCRVRAVLEATWRDLDATLDLGATFHQAALVPLLATGCALVHADAIPATDLAFEAGFWLGPLEAPVILDALLHLA